MGGEGPLGVPVRTAEGTRGPALHVGWLICVSELGPVDLLGLDL